MSMQTSGSAPAAHRQDHRHQAAGDEGDPKPKPPTRKGLINRGR
jgi:hypothetical protein